MELSPRDPEVAAASPSLRPAHAHAHAHAHTRPDDESPAVVDFTNLVEASLETSSSDDDDDAPPLNISLESEHLDPAEKAAHEADTLPLGSEPPPLAPAPVHVGKPEVDVIAGEKASSAGPAFRLRRAVDRGRGHAQQCCPPHGRWARVVSLCCLPLLTWLTCLATLGPAVAAPPGGPIFLLILLVVLALLLGQFFDRLRLPGLLGMLIAGILLKNLPFLDFRAQPSWPDWSSMLRGVALVIILMRAGLGLDPEALKRLSGMVFRLAFTPCLAETLTVAVASHFLLSFPWLWGLMLGFVLAAVSPAVVVPCLLQLQERGYGVAKGIPTLVIAAASVDDVLAISGFTILLGITLKPEQDLVAIVVQGPLEALIGLLFGVFWGGLVSLLPGKDDRHYEALRFLFLFGGGLLALFGTKRLGISGAGALAVLVMAFVAGIGWRKQGWTEDEDNAVAKYFAKLWILFQPILFGLIGTEIQLDRLDPPTIGWGLIVLLIGLTIRVIVSFFSVAGGDLTLKERLFVALAWLPKATVQAAIGPVAYDTVRQLSEPRPEQLERGLQLLTIAVLVILITAPIGAVAIMLSAPKLLTKDVNNAADADAADDDEDAEKRN